MEKTTRAGRRQFVTRGGAADLAAEKVTVRVARYAEARERKTNR